jgi:2-dehydro-3-deoxygluconokinase
MTNHRFDVMTLGEVLLRLSVPAGIRLENATKLDISPAGAEANVAVALAQLGHRVGWFSSLPATPVGRMATNEMRRAAVDLSKVLWRDSGRVGTFFVEFAAPPRAIQVYYDRANSCVSQLTANDVDWDYILDARLIHLSGITPALSRSCCELTAEVVKRAQAANIPLSFDVNFRSKLWGLDEARSVLQPLIEDIEILFCSERDAIQLFNCEGSPETVLDALAKLSRAHTIVLTLGSRGALVCDGKQVLRQPALPVHVIDRFGAGDAFAAGMIHGWLKDDLALGLRYGVTLAALALSQYGDMVTTNTQELDALLTNTNGGLER